MKRLLANHRMLAVLGVLVPLLALFVYVGARSGPLAPVTVTVATVENQSIEPALFGIGTVESRYTYRIGPTAAGRVSRVDVQVGDRVRAGQPLGEMDAVDLNERISAHSAALKRAEADALAAEAQVQNAAARRVYADTQARRYEQLWDTRAVSAEAVDAKRQERQVGEANLLAARANLEAVRQELARVRADRAALMQQRANLRLIAPVDGMVVARTADPGTTVVAGQPVVEVIDPASVWINVRFDQLQANGLRAELPARIVLRSQPTHPLEGRVLRVEPVADAVTEEILAKVVANVLPNPLPPIGELAEVTVALAPRPAAPAVPNASVRRVGGELGVWVVEDGELRFAPVKVGAADLEGRVQILDGIEAGAQVVVYSQRTLSANSRIRVREQVAGLAR